MNTWTSRGPRAAGLAAGSICRFRYWCCKAVSGFDPAVHCVATFPEAIYVLIDFMMGNSFVMRGHSIVQNGLSFTPLLRASVKQ